MPTISTLTVLVNANTRRLSYALGLAGSAIAAAAIAATKMALDFDDAFTKIAAVSNASAEDVAKWKGQVLDLAGETAQAPKELADALFFLASAGLKTSQIMPVLAASAKASAAGLGETADVAKLTANVLNAYAGTGLKAAKVTDILVAAVREGSADTDEFGTVIGRILPIASAAGISFDSVAASLASLSNVGLDVNEGVTAMRGLFQAMVSPTAAAKEAMHGVGLSAQELLDSLQGDGLIATIRMLDEAARKHTDTEAQYMGVLRALVPNVRSLTGMLGLTTQEAERVDSIFQRVSASTGSLDEAFKTTAESAGFKFRQALAELSVIAIKLGDLILPVLVVVANFLMHDLGPAWDATVEWLKKVWHTVEPVVSIIAGPFMNAVQSLWRALSPLIKALEQVWETFGPILKIVAAVGVGFVLLQVTIIGFVLMALAKVVEFAAKVLDALANLAEWLRERFVGAWRAIAGPVLAVIGSITNAILTLIHAVQTAVEWISKLGSGASNVSAFHGRGGAALGGGPTATGGIVTGPQMRLVGEAGPEAIIPLDKAGMMGTTIVNNFYGDVTGEEIVRKVRDGLLRLKARNATTGL